MIERISQLVITGILAGGVYGLLAMGLSLQYGVCRVLNITHGEFVMLAAVLTYTFVESLGINPLVAAAITGPLMFVLGFLLHITVFRTLKARTPSPATFEGSALLVAFGVMYVIMFIGKRGWGGLPMPVYYLNQTVQLAGMTFFLNQIVAFAIAVAIGVGIYIFLTRSRLGRAIRATAEDQATAGLMGVNVTLVLAFAFGLGALLAGIAGPLSAMISPPKTGMGFSNTVIALIVVVLGGLGSVPGSFVAGIIVGIVSFLVVGLWEPVLTVPVYYAILMILLLVRPAGLLGKK
jgi:branched-chain amino acid transport system permease protein